MGYAILGEKLAEELNRKLQEFEKDDPFEKYAAEVVEKIKRIPKDELVVMPYSELNQVGGVLWRKAIKLGLAFFRESELREEFEKTLRDYELFIVEAVILGVRVRVAMVAKKYSPRPTEASAVRAIEAEISKIGERPLAVLHF